MSASSTWTKDQGFVLLGFGVETGFLCVTILAVMELTL